MYESRDVILYFQDLPSHDKFYHLILRQGNPPSLGWEVYFEYGKRGYPPQGKGFKTQGVPFEIARRVFEELYNQKWAKGYRDSLAAFSSDVKGYATRRDLENLARDARQLPKVVLPEQKPTSKPAARKPAAPRLDDDAPVRVFDFDED